MPAPGGHLPERAARVRFRRALTLMAMTLVIPGSAQIVIGNHRVGRIALRIWLGLLGLAALTGLVVLVHRETLFWLITHTGLLLGMRLVLIALAFGWAFLLVDAWRLGQPLSLELRQRRAAFGVTGVLCLAVVAPLLFGAHLVGVQRDFIVTMFGDGDASDANDGRFNVLLLGGDSGAGRFGLRPDSLTVASIDDETGRTVLVSLPRNMENVPFSEGSVMDEEFPRGFDDADGGYLNGVSTWAQGHPDLFGDSEPPGIEATVSAVEGITGLPINYWAMVNLQGFRNLVDAVGGVRLKVRDRIPVGLPSDDFYDHIEPGNRKLDGFETLWFARARHDSDDYSRMARQKCVMNSMLHQISPQQALRNFRDIARASTDMVSTNLPASEVDRFISLALKAREQPVSTVSLVPPKVNTADPDFDEIEDLVSTAIDRAEGNLQSSPSGDEAERKRPKTVTGGSLGSRDSGYAANEAEDLGSAC